MLITNRYKITNYFAQHFDKTTTFSPFPNRGLKLFRFYSDKTDDAEKNI